MITSVSERRYVINMGGGVVWVGSRFSDIKDSSDFFDASITLYGDNTHNNFSLCKMYKKRISNNVKTQLRDEYITMQILRLINMDSSFKFMFYDPLWIFEIEGLSRHKDNYLCLNSYELLRTLENKILFRREFEGLFNLIPATIINSGDLSAELIKGLFSEKGRILIFQKETSNGGSGTFLFEKDDFKHILEHKNENCDFIVSKYVENNTPINAHLAIFENEILVFPGSVQIVEFESHCLLYKGADYIAFRSLSEKSRENFYDLVYSTALLLQEKGFRGICGVDVIIDNNGELYLMEVNPRFQGSSNILNRALIDSGYYQINKHREHFAANRKLSKRRTNRQTLTPGERAVRTSPA